MSPCGIVTWYDPDLGTGLISQDGTGPAIQAESRAIHAIGPRLRPGDRVLFDLTHDSAGLRADNIHRPEDAPQSGGTRTEQ